MSASATARLEARVTPELKQLIEQAAELEGRSITDFIVASTQSAAKQVIQERELLKLGARDREVFVQALMNPPKPNEKLRQAFRRYRETIR
ncbi:MAG TPA: DUF1778 domain-containing protein [Bryobacteraceae bacterium]|nr:DUF1778 domain-containing protein [Bryobacteraceae bacterium]